MLNQWLEIRIPVNKETEEAIANFLFENGSIGCHIDENTLIAYFEEGDWDKNKYRGLIQYLEELAELGFQVETGRIKISISKNRDWNSLWKKSLKPIFVLPDVVIKPTWVDLTPPENALVIEIDPQMAFGSGAHATTQLMLKLMKQLDLKNLQLLDIGTGSGILTIAAIKFGAQSVVACDIDPIAVEIAQKNCFINKTGDNVYLFSGTIDCIRNKNFDVILVNINRREIEKILPTIANILYPRGVLILSGILIEEQQLMEQQLNKYQFSSLTKLQQDEWLGLITRKLF